MVKEIIKQDKWEKELIKKLGSIKIDHTDFNEFGFNSLCSEEIIKIIDIFEPLLTQQREEIINLIEKVKSPFPKTDLLKKQYHSAYAMKHLILSELKSQIKKE